MTDTRPEVTLDALAPLLSAITPKPLDVQIKEQTLRCHHFNNEFTDKAYVLRELSILASLIELQRIRSAERPEPVAYGWFEDGRLVGSLDWESPPNYTTKLYTGELLDAYDRMAAERDAAQTTARVCREDVEINASRAESAESKLARVEEGFRIARRLMGKQTFNDDDVNDMRSIDELLRQIEEGK